MRMLNIVRFNWPMYLQALLAAAALGWLSPWLALPPLYLVLSSLLVSYYVYDLSGLYRLDFLPSRAPASALNLHAGFDETSRLLEQRWPGVALTMLDFYDPTRHTEPSIRRARAFLPPRPGTERCAGTIALPSHSQELGLCFMALHEIRDSAERVALLRELRRVVRGRLYVVEHQRDLANLLAFGPGFTHFHSPAEWRRNFVGAGFELEEERFLTPFVRVFILR